MSVCVFRKITHSDYATIKRYILKIYFQNEEGGGGHSVVARHFKG